MCQCGKCGEMITPECRIAGKAMIHPPKVGQCSERCLCNVHAIMHVGFVIPFAQKSATQIRKRHSRALCCMCGTFLQWNKQPVSGPCSRLCPSVCLVLSIAYGHCRTIVPCAFLVVTRNLTTIAGTFYLCILTDCIM